MPALDMADTYYYLLTSFNTSRNLSRKISAWRSWNVRAGLKRIEWSPQPPPCIPKKDFLNFNKSICNFLCILINWIAYFF